MLREPRLQNHEAEPLVLEQRSQPPVSLFPPRATELARTPNVFLRLHLFPFTCAQLSSPSFSFPTSFLIITAVLHFV
jgi:hypothetical protein